jgi:hypothetical protein
MKPFALAAVALLSVTALASLAGCAAQTGDDAADSEDALSGPQSTLVATLTTSTTEKVEDKCTIQATDIVVSGLDEDVATAINTALANNRTTTFANVDCSVDSFEWQSTMTATLNAKGILSIEESGTSLLYGAAHDAKFTLGHNFDLTSGSELHIKDLLTAKGIANAVTACNTGLNKVAVQLGETSDYTDACAAALTEQDGPASFTVDQNGIRIHPSLGDAEFVLESNGALIPWTAIHRNLTKAGVRVLNASK